MRVADFEGDEFLAGVGGLLGKGGGLDGRAVADADEAEDGGVAFAYAEDVVLEVGADGAWRGGRSACVFWVGMVRVVRTPHLPLRFVVGIGDTQRFGLVFRVVYYAHVWRYR